MTESQHTHSHDCATCKQMSTDFHWVNKCNDEAEAKIAELSASLQEKELHIEMKVREAGEYWARIRDLEAEVSRLRQSLQESLNIAQTYPDSRLAHEIRGWLREGLAGGRQLGTSEVSQ